jgi:hypothetical protein
MAKKDKITIKKTNPTNLRSNQARLMAERGQVGGIIEDKKRKMRSKKALRRESAMIAKSGGEYES